MFVRVQSTPNSPRRSVQVVESSRSGDRASQRIVRHMGIALDADEETKLSAMAEEFIARAAAQRLNEGALFESPPVPRVGRPPRQTRRASSYLSRHQAARGRLLARVTAAVTTSVRSGFRVTVAMCDQLRVAPDHRRGLFWRAWA